MKYLIVSALALFATIVNGTEQSQAMAAHVASPDIYEVLLDNEQVMVLKMTLQPGQADKWHQHRAETVYFEQGGRATITLGDGQALALDIPNGHVMWHDQWQHQVTNTGDTPIVAIIVESKLNSEKGKS